MSVVQLRSLGNGLSAGRCRVTPKVASGAGRQMDHLFAETAGEGTASGTERQRLPRHVDAIDDIGSHEHAGSARPRSGIMVASAPAAAPIQRGLGLEAGGARPEVRPRNLRTGARFKG
jgi:hypothetical protein